MESASWFGIFKRTDPLTVLEVNNSREARLIAENGAKTRGGCYSNSLSFINEDCSANGLKCCGVIIPSFRPLSLGVSPCLSRPFCPLLLKSKWPHSSYVNRRF